jgi:hypothetical protein
MRGQKLWVIESFTERVRLGPESDQLSKRNKYLKAPLIRNGGKLDGIGSDRALPVRAAWQITKQ